MRLDVAAAMPGVDGEEVAGEEAIEMTLMRMCDAMEAAYVSLGPSVMAELLSDGDAAVMASAFVRDCLPDIIVIELLELAMAEAYRR